MTNSRGAMRVLVTGGCGFIGSHVVHQLLECGDDVVVLDDLSVGVRDNLPRHPRLHVVVGSVEDAPLVRAASATCDLVIHLAGIVGMQLVTRASARTYRVSVDGTATVLRETAAPAVLVSSSCVYGHRDRVCRESVAIDRDVALATDAGEPGYATGKWELEALARAARTGGRDVLVVRPFNVVGPRQTHRHGMVLPRFVRAALREEPLVIYDDGQQTRAFSFVEDFVRALIRIASMPGAWARCDGLLNLGDPTPTSILELARIVLEVTRSSSRVEHVPYARAFPGREDIAHRIPDTARAEDVLGPLSWTSVSEIVRRTVETERMRGADA